MTKACIELDTGEKYTIDMPEDSEKLIDQIRLAAKYDDLIVFDGVLNEKVSTTIINTGHIVTIHLEEV